MWIVFIENYSTVRTRRGFSPSSRVAWWHAATRQSQKWEKIVLWGQRGPNFDKARPIGSAEAAEHGGNPAWRHSSKVRVPTRESEALLGTRIELSKQLSYVYISRARATKNKLEINGNGVRFTDIIYVCVLGSENWLAWAN